MNLRSVHGDERGGIVTGWLIQMVITVAIIGFLAYEGIAIGLNIIQVQDDAAQVARTGARAYMDANRDARAAQEAAAERAAAEGVELVAFDIEDTQVTVTVQDTANTLLVHELSFFDSLVTRQATVDVTATP